MLRESNAVITGASSGIGKAIATAIAGCGSSVCLVGRNPARLAAVAQQARATARSVLRYVADLSVDTNIHELRRRIVEEFGAVDIFVHCAGSYDAGPLESAPVQQLDALYQINVRATFLLTQVLLPLLKSRQGQIVFMNSSQGLQARVNTGLYAATQHALKAIGDSLRQEINAEGVRVLTIYPGRTATPRMQAIYQREGRPYRPELLLQPEDIANFVLHALQMPRTAEITNLEIRPLLKSY